MSRKIVEAILQITKLQLSDTLDMYLCQVTDVNEDERTCTCIPVSGNAQSELIGVKLMADVDDGLLYIPAIGSTVMVMGSVKITPYVIMYSELSKIVLDSGSSSVLIQDELIKFNDGSNGGLTNTPELRTQLEKTNELLQSILTVISGPPIPEPGNNAPSSLQQSLAAAISGKTLGVYNAIEDTKITH